MKHSSATEFHSLVKDVIATAKATGYKLPVIPGNIFVITSHGSYEVPDFQGIADKYFHGHGGGKLRDDYTDIVARDGSDYGVAPIGLLIRELNPDAAALPPHGGRMFFNTNAAPESHDLKEPRKQTFGHHPIWEKFPSQRVFKLTRQQTYAAFHKRVLAGIEKMIKKASQTDQKLMVDIHDTDSIVLNKEGKWVPERLDAAGDVFDFPLLLSNRDGKAAHPVVMNILGKYLLDSLVKHGLVDRKTAKQEGVKKNFIYKGGYTTERYGVELPDAYMLKGATEIAQHLHFVQIELNRAMYQKPDRSDIDREKMAATMLAIAEALGATGEAIRDLELGEWREVPHDKRTKEYHEAVGLHPATQI